jgi:transposase
MRFIRLDVHRDFCEVAIAEAGRVRLVGRVQTKPEALALFARSLGVDDEVALEATGNALEIARIIAPHVRRVVLANTKAVKGITQAGAKTDKIDARTPSASTSSAPKGWLPFARDRPASSIAASRWRSLSFLTSLRPYPAGATRLRSDSPATAGWSHRRHR